MANTTVFKRDRWLNPWRLLAWAGLAVILLVPAVAMQFSSEVDWDGADFLLLGLLLGGAAAVYELIAWRTPRPLYRFAAAAVIAGIVLVTWADAAVGVF